MRDSKSHVSGLWDLNVYSLIAQLLHNCSDYMAQSENFQMALFQLGFF